MILTGATGRLADHPEAALGGAVLREPGRRWTDGTTVAPAPSFIADLGEALVTSCFLPVSLATATLYLDQSYEDVETFFTIQPRLLASGTRFELEVADPLAVEGTTVLIGGSPENNWYHWLLNWLPRLALAKALLPDILADATIRFAFHANAREEPYRSTIALFGLPDERLVFFDPERPTRFARLLVPTFSDKRLYVPEALKRFRRDLTEAAGPLPAETASRRIYISRERFSTAKRRLLNVDALSDTFRRFDLATVELDGMTGREQVRTFAAAELVVAVHGAGLANLISCRPGTKVLILDNARNVANGIAGMFSRLAEVMGLECRVLVVEERIEDGVDYGAFYNMHNRDVAADPARFAAELQALIEGPPSPMDRSSMIARAEAFARRLLGPFAR